MIRSIQSSDIGEVARPHWRRRACLALVPAGRHAQRPPTVAAASDLQFALEAISPTAFTARTGDAGRTGLRVLREPDAPDEAGAPFELFLSADEAFAERLAHGGLTRDRGVCTPSAASSSSRPRDRRWRSTNGSTGCGRCWRAPQHGRFAIANPEHAPYGRAAEAALRARGLWESVQPTLVLGENISQAAQFATDRQRRRRNHRVLAGARARLQRIEARYALLPESPTIRRCVNGWCCSSAPAPIAERFYSLSAAAGGARILRPARLRGAPTSQRMDWTALGVSLRLGVGTIVVLLPFGIWLGRLLAVRRFRGKLLVEALVTVPLVLPPTVLGFYLLVTFGARRRLARPSRPSSARRCLSRSRGCCSHRSS